MNLLPLEKLTYRTKLDKDEVIKRIDDFIEPRKLLRMTGLFGKKDHKPYEGKIDGYTFDINRIPNYRNSFLPIIKGNVQTNPKGGSQIQINMRLHLVVIIFLPILVAVMALGFLSALATTTDKQAVTPFLFIALGGILFFYFLVLAAFKYESNKAKKDLVERLDLELDNRKLFKS